MIIPTTFYQDTEEFFNILHNFGKQNIEILRISCARGLIKENIVQIKNLKKKFFELNGYEVSIMVDLPIPKSKPRLIFKTPLPKDRIAKIINGYSNYCKINKNEIIMITCNKAEYEEKNNFCFFLSHYEFLKKLNVNDIIYVGENSAKFRVKLINDNNMLVISETDGMVQYGKYVYSNKLFTSNIIDDNFAELFSDIYPEYVALSFIESKNELVEFERKYMIDRSQTMIVSKVETRDAILNLNEIETYSDYIMIARGDLLNDIGDYEFSYYLDKIIKDSKDKDKYIAATGFFETIENDACAPHRSELVDLFYFLKNKIEKYVITFKQSQNIEAFNKCFRIIKNTKIL